MRTFLHLVFIFFFIQLNTLTTNDSSHYKDSIYVQFNKNITGIEIRSLHDLRKDEKLAGIYNLLKDYKIEKIENAFGGWKDTLTDNTYQIWFSEDINTDLLIRQLQQTQVVRYAEKVPVYEATYIPNDPLRTQQWALTKINAFAAFDVHTGGNAIIAIVDDACKTTHEDISPNLWVNPDEIANNGIDDDGDGYIDNINGYDVADGDNNPNPPASADNNNFSHGTHCSGIASGATNNGVGIASIGHSNKIMGIKCTRNGSSNPKIITHGTQGIACAAASGAHIVSLSWGGENYSQTFQNLINSLYNNGITVVAAAGNDNASSLYYPAAYNHVISVAATNQSDQKASFSNFGTWVDISAPGQTIMSSVATNNSAYTNYSGTSMACPMVAGLLGLMKSYDMTMSPDDLENCLKSTATNIDGVNPSYIGKLGAGRIDALAAINCVNPTTPPVAYFTVSPSTEICVGNSVQFFDQSTNNPTSWNWTFEGGTPATSTLQNPVVTYNSSGQFGVTLTVQNQFGSNTYTAANYISSGTTGTDVYFSENFESGLGAWTLSNPDNGVTWTATNTSGLPNGTKSAGINNFNYSTGKGQRDGLITPTLDFRGRAVISLEFNYAYRKRTNVASDSLIIYASTDNGTTFPIQIFAAADDGNGSFATNLPTNNNFIPQSNSDWCFQSGCISLDISQFAGHDKVKLKFENFCNVSNNLYIDNVQILTSCYQYHEPPTANFSADRISICVPAQVFFSDQSETDIISWKWSFPGGDPASSTEQNPVVYYEDTGSYDVTLEVTNLGGSKKITKTKYIKADEVPEPAFSFTRVSRTVQFTNLTTGNASYTWYFGDGQTSTLVNPSHTYVNDGDYNVRLSVSNACGTFDVIDNVSVLTPPKAGFTADKKSGCAPVSVQFTDSSSSNTVTRAWTFEGGSPAASSERNPIIQYTTSGVFTVRLVVSNSTGNDTLTRLQYINISEKPHAAFNVETDQLNVQFTDQSSGADTLFWNFGDGNTSSLASPLHVYSAIGTYEVRLIAKNNCGSDTLTRIINTAGIPNPFFHVSRSLVCENDTVHFFDQSSGNPTAWRWEFEGGNPSVSTEQNPVISYSASGIYSVTLKASNQYGEETVIRNDFIEVIRTPQGTFDVVVGGKTASVTAHTSYTGVIEWNFGDGFVTTGAEASHEYTQNGVYHIIMTLTNMCGIYTDTTSVSIPDNLTIPTAAYTSDVQTGCIPQQIQFFASNTTIGDYAWEFEGGTPASSTEKNPLITYDIPGKYGVKLTVTNPLGTDTKYDSAYIVILDKPVADFSADITQGNVQFTNTSQWGAGYTWDFGDGNNTSQESPEHTYSKNGKYQVILTTSNICGTDKDTLEVDINIIGTQNIGINAKISVYPVPSNGLVYLSCKQCINEDIRIALYDITGRVVSETTVKGTETSVLDYTNLQAGTYVLRVIKQNEVYQGKLVLEPR